MRARPLILILITKADIGGAQVHVLEILKRLKHKFDFILAVGEEDYLSEQARSQGIEVKVLRYLKRPISLAKDKRSYKECVTLLREIKPDMLHSHSSKAGVIGRLAAWRTNTPSLFTAHGWAFTQGAPKLQRAYGLVLESILCRLKGDVITISEYDTQLANRYHVGWRHKRHLIKNGVSQANATKHNSHAASLNIITVGRLSPVKNHVLLLEALSRLSVSFHLSIIGEGECRTEIIKQINRLGLSNQVDLLGEVHDTTEHLVNADVFVLSSNYEGLPLSVLEAMSLGLPVVSTDVGGVSEAVLHEKTGLLSERGDENGLAVNITRLAERMDFREQLGLNALQHYKQAFTAQRMIDELDSVYNHVLRKTL